MNATFAASATEPDSFKQRQPLPRLPGGDRITRQSETAVFASLGLAAVLTIALALVEAAKFVAGSSQIATALSARQPPLASAPPAPDGKNLATNAVGQAAKPAGVPAALPHKS